MTTSEIQEKMDRAREHLEAAQMQARKGATPQNSVVWLLDGICKAGAELLSIPAAALLAKTDPTKVEK